ncbi:MAG TPA: class I SAM-dependent methyltransferase [Xanthomonadales bacterium]|nr:class I SAM-dependent methyltransferase [Xanthomonadales bacterium]
MTDELSTDLDFTGERFTPECVREIWYEHMHRYVFAGELVAGRNVLDAACGEGYGSFYLAARAKHVTGVDISEESIAHATERYRADNLVFEHADCRELPFKDGEFNCIVSFETLEHLEEQETLLAEFRRVLTPEGFLLISSPDKAVYSEKLKNENPYHVRELYKGEFESLLAGQFPAVELLGHKLAFHSMIWRSGKAGQPVGVNFHQHEDNQVSRTSTPSQDPVYWLALCASEQRLLPSPGGVDVWLFDDASESVYQHYQHEIRKNMAAGGILQEKDLEIEALKQPRQSWWRRLFSAG